MGSAEVHKQNLMQIGRGVREILSDKQTKRQTEINYFPCMCTCIVYIDVICKTYPKL